MFISVLLVLDPNSLYTVIRAESTNCARSQSRPLSQERDEMKRIRDMTQAEFAEAYRHWKNSHGKTRTRSMKSKNKKRVAKK
jgi:hypothetical protein